MRSVLLTTVCLLVASSAMALDSDSTDSPTVPAPPISAQIPIFRSFPTASGQNVLSVGVGFGQQTGAFYITDGGPSSTSNTDNELVLFDAAGGFLGSLPQPVTDGFGWRDAGYTGNHFLYGAGTASTCWYVNETTFAVDNTFTVTGGPVPNRGIGVVSVGGGQITARSSTFGSPISTWTWTIGNPTAAISSSCNVAETGVYGLALDTGRNSLWATTASATGLLHEYDPVTCADKVGSPYNQNPEAPTMGGGEMADPGDGCRLWVINQATIDAALAFDTQGSANPIGCPTVTAVEPATWGSVKARFGH